MKAHLAVRLLGLAFASLALAACNIIPLAPSVTVTVQSTPYKTSSLSISYTYATLSVNSSDGTAECGYVLSKWYSQNGGYSQIDSNRSVMATHGALTFDLQAILNTTTPTDVDGLYALSFTVYSGNYDKNGNPIPIPYLQVTKNFSVYTSTVPEIFSVDPPILNVNNGAQTVKVSGAGFASTTSLATSSASTLLTNSAYVSANSMSATIDPTTLSGGSVLSILATDTQTGTSPNYDIPIVGDVTISSVSPSGDSRTNSQSLITINGSFLGLWTTATITDSSGTKVPLTGTYPNSGSLSGSANLTSLVAGSATVTVNNPDGSSASYPFTVYN